MSSFSHPPPPTSFARLSFPAPFTLLVTLSRPKSLNCINSAGNQELHTIWTWFDAEPSLRVGIITGEGRAFCAGADLKEWNSTKTPSPSSSPPNSRPPPPRAPMPPTGFGGLSRRRGKKPIIAAVNGLAHGGGCEMIVNCDIVLAAPGAGFALPEVKRGVAAIAGALPRLVRTVGRQRAMEMALMGREVSAGEAARWGLVNGVCERDGSGEGVEGGVVGMAVEWAGAVAGNSPDSVVVSKAGVELGWEGVGVEEGTERLVGGLWKGLEEGENVREGLRAFVEKRGPRWVASKL